MSVAMLAFSVQACCCKLCPIKSPIGCPGCPARRSLFLAVLLARICCWLPRLPVQVWSCLHILLLGVFYLACSSSIHLQLAVFISASLVTLPPRQGVASSSRYHCHFLIPPHTRHILILPTSGNIHLTASYVQNMAVSAPLLTEKESSTLLEGLLPQFIAHAQRVSRLEHEKSSFDAIRFLFRSASSKSLEVRPAMLVCLIPSNRLYPFLHNSDSNVKSKSSEGIVTDNYSVPIPLLRGSISAPRRGIFF